MFRTVPPPSRRLLVFARIPREGSASESRLRELLAGIGTSTEDLEIEVMWSPAAGVNGDVLRRAFAPHATAMQTGATLGERLSMALSERFFFQRTEQIVVISADEPIASRELIDHAFALLDSCEYVLGPADDGGYSLIGCRAPSFDPGVFQDIDWGTPSVLASTLAHIAILERTVAVLPRRGEGTFAP